MEKLLVVLVTALNLSTIVWAIDTEVIEEPCEQSEFWYPDLIPHPHFPHPPPKEPEMS